MEESTKLLALETTDLAGSVALCEQGKVLAVRFLEPKQRSAQSLAPAIHSILREFSWKPTDVDIVAVTTGPGSFTGLRVGVATAKMYAWSVGAKIVGVDTLDAIVDNVCEKNPIDVPSPSLGFLVSVGVDAQRGDAAIRNYWVARDNNSTTIKTFSLNGRFQILPCKKWLDAELPIIANEDGSENTPSTSAFPTAERAVWENAKRISREQILYMGPVLSRVKDLGTLRPSLMFAKPELWNPSAADVARVAWKRVLRGSFDNAVGILPVYSRKAAAEEKATGMDALKQRAN